MKTVGSILRAARSGKNISLDDAEKATKIRQRFLDAIENDDYSTLPSLSFARGFVKNYSEFLGLDSKTVLAFFRRQTTEVSGGLLPKKDEAAYNRSVIQLTPGRFLAGLLSILAISFLVYFGLQYVRFNQSPPLTIDSPTDKLVTDQRRIDILGKTDADATVTVNGISVLVRSDGKFFDVVVLEPGVNTITIVATSRLGRSTTATREVGLQLE